MNKTVEQFLNELNESLSNEDTKEMLEFGYFENKTHHYELSYQVDDYETITNDMVIRDIETTAL